MNLNQFEEFGDRGDFVAFGIGYRLAQAQMIFGGLSSTFANFGSGFMTLLTNHHRCLVVRLRFRGCFPCV